jgi:histidinol dehydrogenase
MEIFVNPEPDKWPEILRRPETDLKGLRDSVSLILGDVKSRGDAALLELTKRFDGQDLDSLELPAEDLETSATLVSEDLKQAIKLARHNIERFHACQKRDDCLITTTEGVRCWSRTVPIEKVGLYIPGGSAPLLSTVLMLGIPANLAGCEEIVLCTPPGKDGKVHPAILYCAELLGIRKVFRIGGAQAIAAMAYGTESVPEVHKIFGPGNQYVTVAKQLVSLQKTAIDMPAGPSEVAVIADDTSDPAYVAADLISQAEHGPDSQVLLVSTDETLPAKVKTRFLLKIFSLGKNGTAAIFWWNMLLCGLLL